MLQLLDGYDGSAAAKRALGEALRAHAQTVLASRGGGDRGAVARTEAAVKADPGRGVRFAPDGTATVQGGDRDYRGGRFEIPSLAELRARATARRSGVAASAQLRLWVFDGAGAATDIGGLQATAAPDSLFQVASQFNCLEAPGAFVTAVTEYLHDPTQGPRAAVSAFPAALVRHYAAPAPGGGRFVQRSDGPQIDLLGAVCPPRVAAVRNGYLRAGDVSDGPAFAAALQERFDCIRVGVQDGVEVVLGYDWDGAVANPPSICQVFTSTIAGGMYGALDGDRAATTICRQLLRAAYLGTLLAAASLGAARVCLTLVGGGVFANPIYAIWDALLWAVEQVEPLLARDLLVAVNSRRLGGEVPADELRDATAARGGAVVHFGDQAATVL